MTKSYDATIEQGNIVFKNEKYVLRDLAEVFEDGAKVTVIVKSRRKSRSLSQNSLIHAYFQIIADESGNTLDRVKSCLKRLFLTRDMLNPDGEVMVNPKTAEVVTYVQDTSDLSTTEMMVFTEEVRMWALDFGIILPLPEDQLPLKFK